MSDPLSAFTEALSSKGISSTKPFRVTSKIERFTPAGDHQENGWYILYPLPNAVVGAWGDWKRGHKEKFCSRDKSQCTAQEWQDINKTWRDAEAARQAEEAQNHAEVRQQCKSLFANAPAHNHAYLTKKGVKAHGTITLSPHQTTLAWMAIPLQDETGTIHSAQFIADDGTKRFFYRGRKAGCWFALANNPEGPICIVEGYATGASVHEATGWATVCALDCGNIPAVAKSIRKLHPGRTVLLAADNDQFTPDNPGRTKAEIAARAVSGTVICPDFNDKLTEKPTDFNDLHRLMGISEVKRQLVHGAKMAGDWSLLIEDACDTMNEVIPEPVQIVEGLVCEQAKMVIGGSSKTYKTWFSMDIAMSISVGCQFLRRTCLKSRVLYVNFELKPRTFKSRLQTIAATKGIHFDYQQFYHLHLKGMTSGLKAPQIVDKILALALKRKVSVIVLDPLYKMNSGAKNENEAGEQTVFLLEIDRLVTQAGATVIFDDHFSKGSQSDKDPLDAIRGSSVKGGDVDAAAIIRAHKEKGSFTVSVIQRELPPVDDFVITWQYPIFGLNETLDPADMKRPKGGRPRKVDPMSVLSAFDDSTSQSGYTISSLARKTGMARQTLQPYIAEFRAKSWIKTSGEGSDAFQYITDKGKGILTDAQNAKI